MATSCGYEFQKKHFGFTDAKAEDFYVSQWFRHKGIFVAYRVVLFLYCLSWSIFDTIALFPTYPDWWAFLTEWGEWALVFYFLIALGVSIYGLVHDSSPSDEQGCCIGNNCNQGDLRWFHHLMWVVGTATTTAAYLITIMYWTFLSQYTVVSVAANIHQHVMNSVLVTLDLFMTRVPVRYLHFVYTCLYGITYTLFTLILHGASFKSRFYPGILDWATYPGVSAGVCVGLSFVASPILHAIVFGFYHLRAYIARSCGCKTSQTDSHDEEMGRMGARHNEAFEGDCTDQ